MTTTHIRRRHGVRSGSGSRKTHHQLRAQRKLPRKRTTMHMSGWLFMSLFPTLLLRLSRGRVEREPREAQVQLQRNLQPVGGEEGHPLYSRNCGRTSMAHPNLQSTALLRYASVSMTSRMTCSLELFLQFLVRIPRHHKKMKMPG